MTKKDFSDGIKKLNLVTPVKLTKREELSVYYDALKDIDIDSFQRGIDEIIKTTINFYGAFPSPGAIRSAALKFSPLGNAEILYRLDTILFGAENMPDYKTYLAKLESKLTKEDIPLSNFPKPKTIVTKENMITFLE